MDSIEQSTLIRAGEMIANLDRRETGNIHSVTLTVDGRTGGCIVEVDAELTSKIELLVR